MRGNEINGMILASRSVLRDKETMTEVAADVKVDEILDVKGFYCPMPVLRTKKALDEMATGQILQVIAGDPASRSDIPAFLERAGHSLVEAREADGVFSFIIRKK